MNIKILYQDDYLLVIDKPSGMIVNRSDTTVGDKTVQEWVEAYLVIPNLFRDLGSNEMQKLVQHDTPEPDFYKRAGIVHRLDKETSGILLVAKNPQSFSNLQKQFKERKVKKTYIALVHGKIEHKDGEIRAPVGRLPWNRKRFGVLAGGREAITKYQISSVSRRIKYQISNGKKEPLTLLELYPETGRTHQIRVHLKYFNHPIFSDSFYAGRKTAGNDRKLLPRIFLHASKLSFYHPRNGEIVHMESPLPKELQEFLEFLHRRSYPDTGSV